MPFVSPEVFVKERIGAIQDYSILAGRSFANLFSAPRYWADIFTQMDSIGFGSLPIVVLTGFFTGCVLALQSATSLEAFGAVSMTGNLVALSMVKELGPVLTGLMVSGRNASGMASELGSMKVTEQIDAMRALGTDPVRKLVTPRVIGTIFMLFFLTILSDAVGVARRRARQRLPARPERQLLLSQLLPRALLRRCGAGAHQAPLLRLHHLERRMLLRDEHQGRDPRRRPRHHAGCRLLLGLHHHRGTSSSAAL